MAAEQRGFPPDPHADIDNRFEHHPPSPHKIVLHDHVRADLRLMAHAFQDALPAGREKSLALTKLEEAMFWANAAIARASES